MITRILIASALLVSSLAVAESPIAIAIHAGAGTIDREKITPERRQAIRTALEKAVRSGHAVLAEGGSSLDAVNAAINVLEDAPQFNAGRGAVLTNTETVEMDASIMDGRTLNAGAVAGVSGIRHPIDAARTVMTESRHVMLIGEGAEEFVRGFGLEFKDDDWFFTDFRVEQLKRIKEKEREDNQARVGLSEDWYSTVGAVAVDVDGNLAAATSTGGLSNKRWGRVGDSPIIGAGTYADNRACAVSATGHGEFFIRHAVAHDICARIRHGGMGLEAAADTVVNQVLVEAGATGGVIAIDASGQIAMPFNTPGMYRAAIDTDGKVEVSIYRDGDEDAK